MTKKNVLSAKYEHDGLVILEPKELQSMISENRTSFLSSIVPKFNDNVANNRNLLKRFVDFPQVKSFFSSPSLIEQLSIAKLDEPIFSGPTASHYTSFDRTGQGFGLPLHQDWPSMASSLNSVIVWVPLTECNPKTHSIEVVKGSHKKGIFDGNSEANGYFVSDRNISKTEILEIDVGSILIMSTFLLHKTYANSEFDGVKLALSQRFDDLNCKTWGKNQFVSAYSTVVDRNLFKQIKI